jgi:adenylate cyclase class 2
MRTPEVPVVMLEIEQKFAGVDFAALEHQLAEWGAVSSGVQVEADHYFNAPDRDFAQTDEALRLRQVGAHNILTYKGPKQKAAVKIRTELEVPLADGDEPAERLTQILVFLGYRPVAEVRKERRHFPLRRGGFDLTITLDAVEGLGPFAEVEIVAPEEQKEAAQAVLAETIAALGLTQVERRSYLGLVLAARENRA